MSNPLSETISQISPNTPPAVRDESRFESVDAMRGLVMANLVLLHPLIPAISGLPGGPLSQFLHDQLHHSSWHGLTNADVTLSTFVMLVGMMIPISLRKYRNAGPIRPGLYWKILRRSLLLFCLGVLYNGGFTHSWPRVRLAGVLQRVAVCYLIGAIIFLNVDKRLRYLLIPAILLGYWAAMALISVPGGTAGDYSFDGNLAAWVDQQFLPGAALYGRWDPNGILTTVPAIASCLIGMAWGDLLLNPMRHERKLAWLIGGGLLAINLGAFWDSLFPINKSLWTSSYVLVTAGISSWTLAACYLIVDVWKRPNWMFPFIVIGRNLLAAYLIEGLIPLTPIVNRLIGGDIAAALGPTAPLVAGLVEGALIWMFLYWMYRHKIILKL